MKSLLALFLAAIVCSAYAQPAITSEKTAPRFQSELANTTAPDSTLSRLLVGVSVIQAELSFLPAIQGFAAEYRIAIVIVNAKGDTAAKREESARLQAARLAETQSRRSYAFQQFAFDLPPGEYAAHIALTDLARNVSAKVVAAKTLRNYNAAHIALATSDALWLDRANGEAGNYDIMLLENTTNPKRELALYLEIMSRDRRAPLHVRQTIRNVRREIVLEQQRVWPRTSVIEKLLLPIRLEPLPYGSYEVEMMIQQGNLRQRASAKFRLAWDDIPATALHLNDALGAAKYLATEEERGILQAAMAQSALPEKQNVLQKFWQVHDTTSASGTYAVRTSFYQRLVEVEDHFGGARRGWQTDLGRVYLTEGVPDEIEVHTRATVTQPFQVWRYRKSPKEFLFVDRKGLGLYQLAVGRD